MTGARGVSNRLSLVLGGVRSGKSSFALSLATEIGGPVLFIATAEGGDEEMRARIQQHKQQRPGDWRTLEAPTGVGEALPSSIGNARVVVLDCLSFLVANVMASVGDDEAQVAAGVEAETKDLLGAVARTDAQFIVVSNEVGMGVVPPYPSGRLFRDVLGWANQRLARAAGRVYWMVAGLPVELKASGLARDMRGGS